ncbi:hypothetical protein FJT64_002339 [Amphibalanus amphitrite]|uniref:Uncharacterized protein n=1 Tax=Amphibalanus amphitrite TaxID=1232801 RepID=A0A6A4WHX1_AMPAM|nr:hypothetical protein FJT64_002339 [Amphibalanus amphitrite]
MARHGIVECDSPSPCVGQYCDIDVPEMVALMAEAPNGQYSAEHGWMRSGTEERVRSIITSHVDACVASAGGEGGGGGGDLSDLSDADDPDGDDPEYGDSEDSDDDPDVAAQLDGT